MDPERSRHELMLPYERPYSVALSWEWRTQPGLRRSTYLAGGLSAAAAGCFVAGATWLGLLVLIIALVVTRVALGWGIGVVSATWRKTRGWKGRTELGDVRARRPHAPERDPDVLHDEFAVAVDDDGYLHTWRFRPLDARERSGPSELEIPGRPRYAASPVEEVAFDVRDAGRAAEQLVEAQERAAEREASSARAAGEAAGQAAERAAEAHGTAAALRRMTGQDRR